MQVAARATPTVALEERLWIMAIFLFAVLVHFAVIGGTIGLHTAAALEPAADSRIHIALVQSLLEGHGYSLGEPTAITPPLYIFFLTGLYWVFDSPVAVRIAQTLLAAAGCVIMYAIGRRLFGRTTGLVAAVLFSLYPLTAYLAGLHLTENLFLFLLLGIIWQSLRVADRPTVVRAAELGGLIGLASLTRAAFVAFVPFLLIWTVSLWGTRKLLSYRTFGVALCAAVLVLLPWTIRNSLALGSIVPIQSNGGMVFWAGNNPHSDGGMVWPTRETWSTTNPPNTLQYGWHGLSVAQENTLYVGTALTWIKEHPRDYFRLLRHKVQRLYGFARAGDEKELNVPFPVALFQIGVFGAAVVGLVLSRPRWRTVSLLISLIVFTNITTLVFSGATRYTVPMVPSIVLFAAFALVHFQTGQAAEGAR